MLFTRGQGRENGLAAPTSKPMSRGYGNELDTGVTFNNFPSTASVST
jgi:hypothetical protein